MSAVGEAGELAADRAAATAPVSTLRPTDEVLARALLALRLAGLALAVFVVFQGYAAWFMKPHIAIAAFVIMAAWTAWVAYALRLHPEEAFTPLPLALETVIACAVIAADGWAVHPIITWQIPAIGGIWVLAAPAAVGIAGGTARGAAAGAAVGVARLASTLAPEAWVPGAWFTYFAGSSLPKAVPTIVLIALYTTVGAGVGHLARRLRNAEADLATLQAREDVYRGLHDGVIQTLALLGAKATDPTHARLARDAERDLRSLLFSTNRNTNTDAADLAVRLRDAGTAFAHRSDVTPEFVIAPDLPALPGPAVDAVATAVGEALANVAKHAAASRVVIYAAPEEREVSGDVRPGVNVSVTDDGRGFQADVATGGQGLMLSIRRPVERIGGYVDIRSTERDGTEVSVWAPSASS